MNDLQNTRSSFSSLLLSIVLLTPCTRKYILCWLVWPIVCFFSDSAHLVALPCPPPPTGWLELFRRLNQSVTHDAQSQTKLSPRVCWSSPGDEARQYFPWGHLWVGLPMTLAISMFISSAIGLMERAICIDVVPMPVWIASGSMAIGLS